MKKVYTIYFELFGKKMKTEIKADSIQAAKTILKNKIIIYKVQERNVWDEAFEIMGKLFKK